MQHISKNTPTWIIQIPKTPTKLYALVVSFHFSRGLVSCILSNIFPEFICSLLMGGTYALLVIFSLTSILMSKSKKRIHLDMLLIITVVIITYLFTMLNSATSTLDGISFILYVLIPLVVVPLIPVDIKFILLVAIIIPFTGLPYINNIFITESYGGDVMALSYAMLFPIISNIVYLFIYFKNDSIQQKALVIILSIANSVYLAYILQYGSRGVTLSIIVCIFFLSVTKIPVDNTYGFTVTSIKFVVLGATVIIIYMNSYTFLCLLNDALLSNDITLSFITRTISQMESGSVGSGRIDIYIVAIEEIIKSPIWGHGISTFDYFTGINYPHNIILQILFDGGIILLTAILIPVIHAIKRWKTVCTRDSYAVITAVFMSSVPRGLLSNNAWEIPLLWYFVGMLLIYSKHSNKKLCYMD